MKSPDIAYFIARFAEIYGGEPWFGENMMTKLNQISAKTAFTQPTNGVHSIAELVAHMIYWRSPLVKRLEGDETFKPSMKSEDNWYPLEKLQQEGWDALLEKLNTSQQSIVTLLAQKDANFLAQTYFRATYAQLIQGIIDHDVYHLGQIGLVMKMVKG